MIDWGLFFGAALISFLGTGAIIHYADELGLVQFPNDRSSHSTLTPHGGGFGIVLAGSVIGGSLTCHEPSLLIMLGLAFVLAVVGLVDDIRQLSPITRFVVQLTSLLGLLLLVGELPHFGAVGGWLLTTLLLVAGLWWINLFNFMDGIDGIAAVQAAFMMASGAFLAVLADPGAVLSDVWLLMQCVVAATIGFLVLNWPTARIFMGDVGSLWLAFTIFALSLLSIQLDWLSYAAWLILAAVFVTDSTVTLLCRVARGERWYEAHRTHVYQLLARRSEALNIAEGFDLEKARAKAHLRIILGVLTVDLLWLSPLAWAATNWPRWCWGLVVLAYIPLVLYVLNKRRRLAA